MSKKKHAETETEALGPVAKTMVTKPSVEVERKPLDFEPHYAPLHTDKVVSATILGDVVGVTFDSEANAQHFFAKMSENMVLVESEAESAPSDEPNDAAT